VEFPSANKVIVFKLQYQLRIRLSNGGVHTRLTWFLLFCRNEDNAGEQMQKAASSDADLLETWLILEFCDHGSFDQAIRSGKFRNDLVSMLSFCHETLK